MKRYIALFLAIALLLMCGGCAKKNAYEEAVALMQSGDYDGAIYMFAQLEDYEDSAALMGECVTQRDYIAAVALYDAQDYINAEPALLALGGYKDTAEKAAECRRILDDKDAYDAAVALYEAGDHQNARAALLEMGDYLDAPLLAKKCENAIGYPIEYDGKTYIAMPRLLGTDANGCVTLTMAVSEELTITIEGTDIKLRMCPVGASLFIGGEEYPFSECEYIGDRLCEFSFGVSGEPERVTLYAYLSGGSGDTVYDIDVLTLHG